MSPEEGAIMSSALGSPRDLVGALTQSGVRSGNIARALGVTRQTIHNWQTDGARPTIAHHVRLFTLARRVAARVEVSQTHQEPK